MRLARRGVQEATRLRFIAVFLTWVGYHLSPWLGFLSGDNWESFLLVPRYIDEGLLFSSLAMVALLLGYDSHRSASRRHYSSELRKLSLPKIRSEHLLILGLASVTAFLTLAGGPSEAWASSLPRGFGQFEPRAGMAKLRQMAVVLSNVLHVAAGATAALYTTQRWRQPKHVIFGLACVTVASFKWMWGFSRGAGAVWAFLAFWIIRTHGRRKILYALGCAFVAFYMGWVGYTARGLSNPGIGHYLAAFFQHDSGSGSPYASAIPLPERNPLNAMSAWTRKAEQREIDDPNLLPNALNLAWNLQPLPSEVVPLRPTGRDLAEVMGTVGSTGLTTSALGEMYYVFGLYGALCFVILGRALTWFDLVSFRCSPLLSAILTTVCAFGLVVGLHSSTRAMTRPFLYGLVLYYSSSFLRSRHRQTSQGSWRGLGIRCQGILRRGRMAGAPALSAPERKPTPI